MESQKKKRRKERYISELYRTAAEDTIGGKQKIGERRPAKKGDRKTSGASYRVDTVR